MAQGSLGTFPELKLVRWQVAIDGNLPSVAFAVVRIYAGPKHGLAGGWAIVQSEVEGVG
jgi:hypothetical protein